MEDPPLPPGWKNSPKPGAHGVPHDNFPDLFPKPLPIISLLTIVIYPPQYLSPPQSTPIFPTPEHRHATWLKMGPGDSECP